MNILYEPDSINVIADGWHIARIEKRGDKWSVWTLPQTTVAGEFSEDPAELHRDYSLDILKSIVDERVERGDFDSIIKDPALAVV